MRERAAGHLLVVDDNRVNRLLLTRGLEENGHQVETAENGKQALKMLRGDSFDLLLLDIEMPELNGFQVLEALLKDPKLSDIPVIMTSASDELDSVVKCIEMGAEDYLTKPLNPILLRARVNASLEKKRLRDQQRRLFRTFATPEVAEELLKTGFTLGGKHVEATAMFADIRSFTTLAESQDPALTIDLLNDYFQNNLHVGDIRAAKGMPLLDAVIKLRPDYVEAWNRRATLYYLRNDYTRSLQDIEQVLVREPRHFGALAGLGMIMQDLGDDKRALDAFRQALAINPHLDRIPDLVKTLSEKVEGRDI